MELLTEPVSRQSRPPSDTRGAKEWLDTLSSGGCSQEAFYRGVADLLQRTPDAGWELLALVDQYYRRGKINADSFVKIKAHLQVSLMGNGQGAAPRSEVAREQPAPRTDPAREQPAPQTDVAPAPQPERARGQPAPFTDAWDMPIPAASERSARLTTQIGPPPPEVAAPPLPTTASAPTATSATTATSAPTAVSAPATEPEPRDAAAARSRPERSLVSGDVLRGRYRIQGVLGRGGMGTVYEALDQYRVDEGSGEQRVAVKVLHTAVIQRPRLFAELRREFQHLQSLSHPNIVRVHEFDRDGDIAFFTMEYLSGRVLSHVLSAPESALRHRPYALAIIRDVGNAMAHAHGRHVVHGDLNPGNIFIDDSGHIRILDFGTSHLMRRAPWISELDEPEEIIVATPSYASCQLLEGEPADARDDVYAMACIAYVLLTEQHPFQNLNALRARSASLRPRRPRGLAQRQWNALRAGLHFERERRPADLHAWLGRLDLRAAADHLPTLPLLLAPRTPRPSVLRWVASVCAIAALATAGWWVSNHVDSVDAAAAAAGAEMKSLTASFGTWRDGNLDVSSKPTLRDAVRRDATPRRGAPSASDASNISHPNVGAALRPSPTGPAANTSSLRQTHAPQQAETASASDTLRQPQTPQTAETTRDAPAIGETPPVDATSRTGSTASPAAAPGIPAAAKPGTPFRARIELSADTVEVSPADDAARLVVRRTRTLRGDASFSWWTESGTAKPGRDFVAVKPHIEHIPEGRNALTLTVPIVPDPRRRDARSFYVVIDQAGEDAAVGPRTLTMVSLAEGD